jgi:hypothetical protein
MAAFFLLPRLLNWRDTLPPRYGVLSMGKSLLLISLSMFTFTFRVAASEAGASNVVVLAVASSESHAAGLPVLRYPQLDLRRFVDAMTSMAGVKPDRIVIVRDGSLAEVKAAFLKARNILETTAKTSEKSKFVFYYSGHADTKGLHFSDGSLERDDFHELIAKVAADTKVAILDSCYSGALSAKGIKISDEFAIPKAQFDEPTGAVFLAATSASDQAFEIDELKGSLFTHHLTGGLYGLADFNQDGLVTVEELYQHIYKQVNLNSLGLPDALQQKPEYSSRLSGRGALVMSFVKQKTSEVVIEQGLIGEITFSAKRGVQMFRVLKSDPEKKSIRLTPGLYELVVRNGDQIGQMEFEIEPNRPYVLAKNNIIFRDAPNLRSVAKGGRSTGVLGIRVGSHVGSMMLATPYVEGFWSSNAVRLPMGVWRLNAATGGHVSTLEYDRPSARTQRGKSTTLSFIFGGTGDFEMFDAVNGLSLTSMAGFGSDFSSFKWDDKEPGDRDFEPTMPKVALGVGVNYLQKNGHIFEVSFRREWLFGTERSSGDVLSFSASLLLLGYHF